MNSQSNNNDLKYEKIIGIEKEKFERNRKILRLESAFRELIMDRLIHVFNTDVETITNIKELTPTDCKRICEEIYKYYDAYKSQTNGKNANIMFSAIDKYYKKYGASKYIKEKESSKKVSGYEKSGWKINTDGLEII